MMKKKQTAVEWLYQQMLDAKSNKRFELLEQALMIEKEQITDAHYEGQCDNTEGYPKYISEHYYYKTYGI